MPVLVLVCGLMLASLAWWSIEGIRAVCCGSGGTMSALQVGFATVLLAGCARSSVPVMSELRSLPGGTTILLLAELGWAVFISSPILILVLVGLGWALAVGTGFVALVRGAALLCGVVSITWATLVGRSWPGWVIFSLGMTGLAASTIPDPMIAVCVLALLALALPSLALRIPPSLPNPKGRTGRGWAGVLINMLRERPAEASLRLSVAAVLAAGGGWWLAGWQPSERPPGLVLIAGCTGLAVNGLAHLALDFRAARSELFKALPMSDMRWRVLSYAVPLTWQVLAVGALAVLAIVLGSSPLSIGLAAGIALAVACGSLWLLEAYPDNGPVMAVALLAIAVRGMSAVGP